MTREELLDELEYYGDIKRPATCPITTDDCYNPSNCAECKVHEDFIKWLEEQDEC